MFLLFVLKFGYYFLFVSFLISISPLISSFVFCFYFIFFPPIILFCCFIEIIQFLFCFVLPHYRFEIYIDTKYRKFYFVFVCWLFTFISICFSLEIVIFLISLFHPSLSFSILSLFLIVVNILFWKLFLFRPFYFWFLFVKFA